MLTLLMLLLLLLLLGIRRPVGITGSHVSIRHHRFRVRIDGRRPIRHSAGRHDRVSSSSSSSSCRSAQRGRGGRDEIRSRELIPLGPVELAVDVVLDVEGGVVGEGAAVDVESRTAAVGGKRVGNAQGAAHRLGGQERGSDVLPLGRLVRRRLRLPALDSAPPEQEDDDDDDEDEEKDAGHDDGDDGVLPERRRGGEAGGDDGVARRRRSAVAQNAPAVPRRQIVQRRVVEHETGNATLEVGQGGTFVVHRLPRGGEEKRKYFGI